MAGGTGSAGPFVPHSLPTNTLDAPGQNNKSYTTTPLLANLNMSWFSVGSPSNTKKTCNDKHCEHCEDNAQQNHQHIPAQVQQALAQGFQPIVPVSPQELQEMKDSGMSQEDIMKRLQEVMAEKKRQAIADKHFIESPKFTEAKEGYAFQM